MDAEPSCIATTRKNVESVSCMKAQKQSPCYVLSFCEVAMSVLLWLDLNDCVQGRIVRLPLQAGLVRYGDIPQNVQLPERWARVKNRIDFFYAWIAGEQTAP